ncbi:Thiol-disulfide isomerase/thioredoxin [Stackebrandtia soli]
MVAIVLAATLAACGSEPAAQPPTPEPSWSVDCRVSGEVVPATDFEGMELPCLGGDETRQIGVAEGRPLLVTLWASWCRPCVAEAPELTEFHRLFGDRIDVLGVDTQDNSKAARYFAEDVGLTFPSLVDERGDVMRSQGLATLPATFLIDGDGDTVARFTDATLTADDLIAAVEEHLGMTP